MPPRPSPPQLGWEAIRAANASLELNSESPIPKGRWGRLDVGEAVGRLFRTEQAAETAQPIGAPSFHAMPTAGTTPPTNRRAAPRRATLASRPPVVEEEYEEEDEDQFAHDFWAGGQRLDELLEWSLAEIAATGIDPMAQVPAPYCAPAGWRSARQQPQ